MHLSTIPIECFAFDKILQPSAECQLCLRQQSSAKDFIITCNLCRSSIHQKHYGGQLLYGFSENWMCQRCREMKEFGPSHQILCKFCPSKRGIMTKTNFENQIIWVHPQCSGWLYPIYGFYSNKRDSLKINFTYQSDHAKFWHRVADKSACSICKSDYGKPIKCMYYSCTTYFHVTCGKREGVVRDLESMRLTSMTGSESGQYSPVYCKVHLEKRIQDFKFKAKQSHARHQEEKSANFNILSHIYSNQLNNLINSAKKYQFEEDLRSQLNFPVQGIEDRDQELTFSDLPSSHETHHSPEFINFLQQAMPFHLLYAPQKTSKLSEQVIELNLQIKHQEKDHLKCQKPMQLQEFKDNILNQKKQQN